MKLESENEVAPSLNVRRPERWRLFFFFFLVSGWSFVYEGCYGQSAEQLPALSTGGGRSAQEESGNYKEPQDLNTITHTPSQIKTTLPPHHHHHHHQPLNAPHRRLSAHQPTHESDKPRLTRLDPAQPARRAHSRYWPPPFFFFFLQPGIFFFCFFLFFHLSDTHAHLWDICNSYSTQACK